MAERIQIVENLRNRPKQSSIGRSLHPAFYLILEAEVIRLSQKLTNKQFSKAVTHHTNWSWPSLKICLTLPSPLSQHHIVYSLCLCLKNTVGALTYDVRCFWGIFDLPTYPNQILYYISLFSRIRWGLTYQSDVICECSLKYYSTIVAEGKTFILVSCNCE